MFTKKKSSAPKTTHHTEGVTFIATDCTIIGDIVVQGDLRIDGKIEGKVESSGEVIIGAGATIRANIEGKTIVLAGEVHGNIQTLDLLHLTETARLYGDISSKLLTIDQGAVFIGRSNLIVPEEPQQN